MRTKSMTEGSPLRLIFSFSLPLMFANVFQQLYTVMDTAIVGQVLGVNALAALGAADSLHWMCLGSIQGLTQGFSIRMAQEFGANDTDSLHKTVGHSIILSIILSAILIIFFQGIASPALQLMKTPSEIADGTLLYLRILYSGIPIVIAYNLMSSMLRAVGDSQTPLYAAIAASFINIVLDLFFVRVLGFGIAGAAAATLIAQFCSVIYCWHILCKLDILHPQRKDLGLTFILSKQLMLLGFPMAFQNFIIAVGSLIVQHLVNLQGVIFIAGYTATFKLYGMLEIAATSYGFAIVTYTGQNIGAGNAERVRKGLLAALKIALLTSIAIGSFLLIFGKSILGLFISGTPEEVAATLGIAYQFLSIMSICLPLLYILYVFRSALQGLGDTISPLMSGIAEFFMRTGCVILLPLFIGSQGIFFAEVLAWTGADLVLVPSCLYRIKRLGKSQKLFPPHKNSNPC